jgi:signal transduction histidine kinase
VKPPGQNAVPAELCAADNRRRRDRIAAGLVESLYARTPVTLVVNVVIGLLTVTVLWNDVPAAALGVWLAAVVALSSARAVLWLRFRNRAPHAAAVLWGWMSAAGSAAAGLLWGAAAIVFFVPGAFVQHVFLAFVLGGMAAGAVASLTSFLPAFHFFITPALGAPLAMFLRAGDQTHLVMAAMLGIFGLALAAIARDMNRVQVQSLGLRFDNVGLIRTLFEANEEAQSASRAKSVFLASMSHELRTPLNAIIGFSEIMRDELFGPLGSHPYREYAVLIHESAEHLLDVISDVLDASKAETGTLAIEEGIVDTGAVVRNCIGVVAGTMAEKTLSLTTDLDPEVPRLRADHGRVRQIILNLLLNAVKFTPPQGRVTLRVHRDAEGGLVLSVADTGIGMSQDDMATALEPFAQVDSSLTRRFPGTGLGLPLARALMRLHGGDLSLESRVGQGTTVTVRFPRERVLNGNGKNGQGRKGNGRKGNGRKGDGGNGGGPGAAPAAPS